MPAATYDITLEQFADFAKTFTLKKKSDGTLYDLTGYTPTAQLRRKPSSTSADASFTCSVISPGKISMTLSHTVTTTLADYIGFWDMTLIHTSGTVLRILQGRATVSAGVTR